jgi:hypothetical protein
MFKLLYVKLLVYVSTSSATVIATGFVEETQYLASLRGMMIVVLCCYLLKGVSKENVIPEISE